MLLTVLGRAVLVVLGLCLLFAAALSNYSSRYIFADHYPAYRGQPVVLFRSGATPENAETFLEYLGRATIFVHVPGMPGQQFRFFPFWWLFGGVLVALLCVGLCFRRFRQAIVAPWRGAGTALPLAGALFFLAFTVTPWDWLNAKAQETGAALVMYLVLAGTGFAMLVAGLYRALAFLDRPAAAAYRWLMGMDRRVFMLVTTGFMFVVANVISWLVFEHMPHIQDSISQLFQARIFAAGKLWLPSPRFADFFDYTHIINNGQWYSQYPFLHSLLLLPGVLAGVPWMINPLLGALTVPVVYLLGREVYDEQTGRLAAVLTCFTPFIFNMSAEYMNHTSALLFAALFTLFFFRTIREPAAPVGGSEARGAPSIGGAALAGLFIGLCANVRPFSAAAFVLPFGAYGLWLIVRKPGRYLSRFAAMALVAGAVTSLYFVYNWLTNGDPMLFGYVVKWGPGHEVGFGKSGWGPQHTPFKGLLNMGNDFNLLNKFFFEWPFAAVLPTVALVASGTRDRRDWLLFAATLALPIGYFFYWFHNVCFGPRFLYESSAAFLLLTVRGFQSLAPLLRRTFRLDVPNRSAAQFAGRILPLALVWMAGVGLPPLFKLYNKYGWVDSSLLRAVKQKGLTNALVFCSHFGAGFTANSLALDGDVVYAKDYGPVTNAALTVAYPEREYWLAKQDTLRPAPEYRFERSRLREVLAELVGFMRDSVSVQGYRYVIWPFGDLPPPMPEGGPAVVDYRQISREIFRGTKTMADYMPALAFWFLGDDREHLRIFSDMDEVGNFISDNFKFTLFHVTPQGDAAVFDIRRATGREITVPDGGISTPAR